MCILSLSQTSPGFHVSAVQAYMPYVPDCLGQSQILILCPRNYEIVPKISKIKATDFLRQIECVGFVIHSCLNDKCCICYCVPIISGIPVDRQLIISIMDYRFLLVFVRRQ